MHGSFLFVFCDMDILSHMDIILFLVLEYYDAPQLVLAFTSWSVCWFPVYGYTNKAAIKFDVWVFIWT